MKRKEAVYLTLCELLHIIRAFMCVFFSLSSVFLLGLVYCFIVYILFFLSKICAFFIDFSCRFIFLFRIHFFHSTHFIYNIYVCRVCVQHIQYPTHRMVYHFIGRNQIKKQTNRFHVKISMAAESNTCGEWTEWQTDQPTNQPTNRQ